MSVVKSPYENSFCHEVPGEKRWWFFFFSLWDSLTQGGASMVERRVSNSCQCEKHSD